MRHSIGFFGLALACFAAGGCSRGGSQVHTALPLGTYQVEAPVCLSTGQAPAYPNANYKVVLFAFDGLTSHTLSVERFKATETLQDADCTVTVDGYLYQNADQTFALQHNRRHIFTPAGCSLAVVVNGLSYAINPATSDLFKDSDDHSEEIPFTVAATEDGYSLTSEDRSDLNDLWNAYGCAKPDRIQMILRPGR